MKYEHSDKHLFFFKDLNISEHSDVSYISKFGCHGGEAVGLGYTDNQLTGHFLIRSLLDADILCAHGHSWTFKGVSLCRHKCVYESVCVHLSCAYKHLMYASIGTNSPPLF